MISIHYDICVWNCLVGILLYFPIIGGCPYWRAALYDRLIPMAQLTIQSRFIMASNNMILLDCRSGTGFSLNARLSMRSYT
jgi:hypothetical protein